MISEGFSVGDDGLFDVYLKKILAPFPLHSYRSHKKPIKGFYQLDEL